MTFNYCCGCGKPVEPSYGLTICDDCLFPKTSMKVIYGGKKEPKAIESTEIHKPKENLT